MKLLKLILITLILSSCAHSVHLNHVSDFSPSYQGYTNGKIVKARTEQFVILGFASDTNYVDEAYKKIQTECPTGDLQGVNTQYSTSLGFFSWTNTIDLKALCL